jgi:WD40 repeat protein
VLNSNDAFSPENVDEQLELLWSVLPSEPENSTHPEMDVDKQLMQDLHHLYTFEKSEQERSLQRVWERLEKQSASLLSAKTLPAPVVNEPLRLLKPDPELAKRLRRRSTSVPGRGWAVLAATLFLVIMLGSLVTMLHFVRLAGSAGSPTVAVPTYPAQPTPPPGYPYPAPGRGISTLPVSTDNFYSLSWSPDGKQVATATENKARVWDLASEKYTMLAQAPATAPSLRAVAWSPDGQHLAIGTNPVRVVDPSGRTTPTSYPVYVFWPTSGNDNQATITALAWSPDSTMIAIAALRPDNNGCVVEIWNIQTNLRVNSYDCQNSPNGISSLSWSADDHFIASADGQSIQVWNAFTNTSLFQQPIASPTNVAWAPGSSLLLAFVSATTTQIWNINTLTAVSLYPHSGNGVLAWAPDGRYLATANQSQVTIWDTRNSTRIYTYTSNLHDVLSLAWSPDGNYLISGESGPSGYNFARIWAA